VVNDKGELVGVISASNDREPQLATCIDVEEVKQFLSDAHPWVNLASADDYKKRGLFYLKQGRHDRAIADFKVATGRAPKDPDGFVLLGRAQCKSGQYDEAIKAYTQALKLEEKNVQALTHRGDAYRLKREYDLAIKDLDDADQSSKGQYPLALFTRSLVYRAKEDLTSARKDYQTALKLDPKLAEHRPDDPPDELQRLESQRAKYLPEDAEIVIYLNVKQLLPAPAIKRNYVNKLDQILKEPEKLPLKGVQTVLTTLGIEPLQHVTSVVLAGSSSHSTLDRWRLLLHGRFDADEFHAVAGILRFPVFPEADALGGFYQIYIYADRFPGQPGLWYFALANSTTLVIAPDKQDVVDVLTKAAGWKKTELKHQALRAGLGQVDAKQGAWWVALGRGLVRSDGKTAEQTWGVETITGSLTVTADVEVKFVVAVKSAAAAQKLAKDIETTQKKEWIGFVDHLTGPHKELAPLVPLVKDLQVTPEGNTVRFGSKATENNIDKAFQDRENLWRTNPRSVADYLRRAADYAKDRKYADAIKDYTAALRLGPDNAVARRERGYSYFLEGKRDDAINDLTEATRLDPNDALAFRRLGLAYSAKQKFDEAIKACTEAIRLAPQDPEALADRAAVYNQMKIPDTAKAIADCNKALQLFERCGPAFRELGVAHRHKKQYQKAYEYCWQATYLHDNLAFREAGIAAVLGGEYETAVKELTRAIKLFPNDAQAYWWLAKAYEGQRKHKEAKQSYEQARKLDPTIGK
jgi:tetratricopeptide (TPR) repeat protein